MFAEKHGIERVTTDWETLVTDRDVDAVIIGTPNNLHAPQALAAIGAAKDVLVEKPMAMNVAEAERMIAAAQAVEVELMVAHMWRYRDEVRALRARIEAGELGADRAHPRLRRPRASGARPAGSPTPCWPAAAR